MSLHPWCQYLKDFADARSDGKLLLAPFFGHLTQGGGLWVYKRLNMGWPAAEDDVLCGPTREGGRSLAILAAITVLAHAFDQDEHEFTAGLPNLLADIEGMDVDPNGRKLGHGLFPTWVRVPTDDRDSELFKLSALPYRIPIREPQIEDQRKANDLERKIIAWVAKNLDQTSCWVPRIFACLMFPFKNRSAACAFALDSPVPVFGLLREWERLCNGRPAEITIRLVARFAKQSGAPGRVRFHGGLHLWDLFRLTPRVAGYSPEARGSYRCGNSDEKSFHSIVATKLGATYTPPEANNTEDTERLTTTVCHSDYARIEFDRLFQLCIQSVPPALPNLALTDGRAPVWEVPRFGQGNLLYDILFNDKFIGERRVFVGLAAHCTNGYPLDTFRSSLLGEGWVDRSCTQEGGWVPHQDPARWTRDQVGDAVTNRPIIRHAPELARGFRTSVVFISMRDPITLDARFLVMVQPKQSYNGAPTNKRPLET